MGAATGAGKAIGGAVCEGATVIGKETGPATGAEVTIVGAVGEALSSSTASIPSPSASRVGAWNSARKLDPKSPSDSTKTISSEDDL